MIFHSHHVSPDKCLGTVHIDNHMFQVTLHLQQLKNLFVRHRRKKWEEGGVVKLNKETNVGNGWSSFGLEVKAEPETISVKICQCLSFCLWLLDSRIQFPKSPHCVLATYLGIFCGVLIPHNWQKWKRVFLTTSPCHKIYRDDAVGLKSCKYTLKITIFVNMWNLGQFCENLIFVNNCVIEVRNLNILLHMCDTYNCD